MTQANKTVLVTGGAKRLGRAIALKLAEDGWAVAVHYRASAEDAEETAAAVRAKGARAACLQADLADADAAEKLVPRAREALGPLTALINNASLFERDDIATFTAESWNRHIGVNLYAPLVLARAFAKQLPEGAEGAIINLLDQRLLKPTPHFLSYSVSKAGLGWLTRTLAQALAPRIRVNGVAPGPTLPSPYQTEAQFRRQGEATLLGHGASPQDIAEAVRYLTGARAVTGHILTVDGGQHLVWRTRDVSHDS